MATVLDNLAKHFDCAICMGRLTEPKILKCQHTYCRGCLEKLVEKSAQWIYVNCPECREKTEIPPRGVKDLQPNFLINKLLSELDKKSTGTPVCVNHQDVINLYCESCDQLICRDCAIRDHREHKYKYVKDIYPAEKKKIEEVVTQSQLQIFAFERALKTINNQEARAEINYKEVNSKVDDVIDNQIKLLNEKRKSLKAEIKELTGAQKQHRNSQKKYFESSLNSMRQSVNFVEQTLRKGNEVEVLSAKKQIIKKLTDATDMAKAKLEPRGMILYDIEIDSPHDKEVLGIIPKIIEFDEEYTVKMRGYAIIGSAQFESDNFHEETFDICSKSKRAAAGPEKQCDVKVKIKHDALNFVHAPDVAKNDNGSFSFSFMPDRSGDYEIEVMLNGRFVQGSPFKWQVIEERGESRLSLSDERTALMGDHDHDLWLNYYTMRKFQHY